KRTRRGSSCCIACLSTAMSHSAGGARPVSDSFTPGSPLNFLMASSLSVYAMFLAMLTTGLTNCLTIIIYLGSAAVVGHLFDSPTSARSLAYK
ncbi:hypothetical protein PFISCL1PPCAC_25596, partial [Pristionchus fissidentatus]